MSELTIVSTIAQAGPVASPDGGKDSTRSDEVIEATATTSELQTTEDSVDPEGGTASSRLANMLRGHQVKGQGSTDYAEDGSEVVARVQE